MLSSARTVNAVFTVSGFEHRCLLSGNRAGGDGPRWKPVANQPQVEAHLSSSIYTMVEGGRGSIMKILGSGASLFISPYVRWRLCSYGTVISSWGLWHSQRRLYTLPVLHANSKHMSQSLEFGLLCNMSCVCPCDKWCSMTGSWEHAYGLLIALCSCLKTQNMWRHWGCIQIHMLLQLHTTGKAFLIVKQYRNIHIMKCLVDLVYFCLCFNIH